MKIAVAGKGGVGKPTICASLARLLADNGEKVFAIDADPNANLALSLGFSQEDANSFIPVVEMKSLIEERTGASPGAIGNYFTMNPRVDDLPDRFKKERHGVMLLVVGAMKEPSAGCYCPENAFLKSLLMNMVFKRDETIMLDMEAGFEHLTRGTAQAFDAMLIVMEPSVRAVSTAEKIRTLAEKTGVRNIFYIINKVAGAADRKFIEKQELGGALLGFITHSAEVLDADRNGQCPYDACQSFNKEIGVVGSELFSRVGKSGVG